jgi:periplasmic divalent cation tolerance protein
MMNTGKGQILVVVTVPDQKTGQEIARKLLEKRLAACVNISPGWNSLYHWEGEIQQDQEVLLLIKTRQDLLDDGLIPVIQELHPYQLPEIIALELTGGERHYLDWILQETTPESSS